MLSRLREKIKHTTFSSYYSRKVKTGAVVRQELHRSHFNMLAYDKTTKRVVDSATIDIVDRILKMRKDNSPWEVIDYLIEIWYETTPEDAEGTQITIRDLRETRKDQKYGQTDDKNMERRLVFLFPLGLQSLIRKVYTAEELPFDKQFVLDFANRYPIFRIPEKV